MNFYIESIDSISFLLFTLILYFLSVLSKRLGDVMGTEKYYYIYYAGMVFTFLGSLIKTVSLAGFGNLILIAYIFFAFGLTLGIIASIKYWGWLIREIVRG